MNTLNFPDSNVWIALLWDRHLQSERARKWFEAAGEEQFFFCRFTQITVLRLLTTESVMGGDTKTMSGAWKVWDRVLADTRISLLAEPHDIEEEFRSHSRLSSQSPKMWADAYLLAFAVAAGLKFVTFDRALRGKVAELVVL